MKLSMDFGRWTRTKIALAVSGAIGLAGAVGSAVAFSPTIIPPIKWQGGAEFAIFAGGTGAHLLYTVPAGRNFLLTDLVLSNQAASSITFQLFTNPIGNCGAPNSVTRLGAVTLALGQNPVVIPFQTGIGVASGHAVCASTTGSTTVSGRGFLFTPQPAG